MKLFGKETISKEYFRSLTGKTDLWVEGQIIPGAMLLTSLSRTMSVAINRPLGLGYAYCQDCLQRHQFQLLTAYTQNSPESSTKLRSTLLRCGPFDSNANLRTIFIDARLYPWREDVPEANSRGKRVDTLIEDLHDQCNPQGENALVLFLHALAERISPGDACRRDLSALADQIAALPSDDTVPVSTASASPGQNINVSGTGNTVTVVQQNAGDNATQVGQVTGDVDLAK